MYSVDITTLASSTLALQLQYAYLLQRAHSSQTQLRIVQILYPSDAFSDEPSNSQMQTNSSSNSYAHSNSNLKEISLSLSPEEKETVETAKQALLQLANEARIIPLPRVHVVPATKNLARLSRSYTRFCASRLQTDNASDQQGADKNEIRTSAHPPQDEKNIMEEYCTELGLFIAEQCEQTAAVFLQLPACPALPNSHFDNTGPRESSIEQRDNEACLSALEALTAPLPSVVMCRKGAAMDVLSFDIWLNTIDAWQWLDSRTNLSNIQFVKINRYLQYRFFLKRRQAKSSFIQ